MARNADVIPAQIVDQNDHNIRRTFTLRTSCDQEQGQSPEASGQRPQRTSHEPPNHGSVLFLTKILSRGDAKRAEKIMTAASKISALTAAPRAPRVTKMLWN
jgi:hypothetical protein